MAMPARTLAAFAVAAAVVAGLVVGVPAVAPVRAQDGDPAVAASLLKSGKSALVKKSWDEAITFFDRALRERPELVEAQYQKAVALERKGDRGGAVAAYRRFVELLKDKAAEAKAAADENALGPQAEKRIAALAAGETELGKLESAFDARLLAFAKKHAAKDAAIAVRALKTLLEGDPDHAEARDLLAKLGGEADAAPSADARPSAADTGPFAHVGVRTWDDLIARKKFTASSIEYGSAGFVIDTQGGKVISPAQHDDYGTRYAYEAEFRVTQEKERGWLVGLDFAQVGDEFLSAFLQRGQVVLTRGNLKTGPAGDIASEPLKSLDLAKWHRLGVKADGAKVEVWLDGTKLIGTSDSGRTSLAGDLGLFQQRCRAEWRVLRAGKIE